MAKIDARIAEGDTNNYLAGRAAREMRQPKDPPGSLIPRQRSWWLAGWNDRDIELESLYSGFCPGSGVGQDQGLLSGA